jgi:hypothetical protein
VKKNLLPVTICTSLLVSICLAGGPHRVMASSICSRVGESRSTLGTTEICRPVGSQLLWTKLKQTPASPKVGTKATIATTTSTIKKPKKLRPAPIGATAVSSSTTQLSPATSVAPVLTCATGGPCKVGDYGAAGGIVFYVPPTRQPWGRYLEATPVGWNRGTSDHPSHEWGCRGVPLDTARVEIGGGKANTEAIVSACQQRPIAASVANDLVFGGFDDWFLPSSAELNALYRASSVIGGVLLSTTNQWYYSSTSTNSDLAFAQMFTTDQANPSWYAGRIDVWPRYLPWRGLIRPIRYGS